MIFFLSLERKIHINKYLKQQKNIELLKIFSRQENYKHKVNTTHFRKPLFSQKYENWALQPLDAIYDGT